MRLLLRLLASLGIAALIPSIQARIVCHANPFSEACVWGKAYLPLSTSLSTVFLSPVVFALLWGIEAALRRRR